MTDGPGLSDWWASPKLTEDIWRKGWCLPSAWCWHYCALCSLYWLVRGLRTTNWSLYSVGACFAAAESLSAGRHPARALPTPGRSWNLESERWRVVGGAGAGWLRHGYTTPPPSPVTLTVLDKNILFKLIEPHYITMTNINGFYSVML